MGMTFGRPTGIGLYVAADFVSAVALERGRIKWAADLPRDEAVPLAELLTALMHDAPRSRVRRPVLLAAVGPSAAQVRNVGQLAESRNAGVVTAVVAANSPRFFLVNGTPVRITHPQWAPDGGAWIGAIELATVTAISSASDASRLRLGAIAPAAASIGHAIRDDDVIWRDGAASIAVTFHGTLIASYRRTLTQDEPSPRDGRFAQALGEMDSARAMRLAPAYAAARAGTRVPLGIPLSAHATASMRRLTIAALVFALSLSMAAVVPPLVNQRRASHARARLSVVSRTGAADALAERELARRITLLRELTAFHAGAHSATLLLASLTNRIEAPSMVQSLQLDTLGGMLVASTPRAARLIAMLDAVPAITGARISGAVSQDPKPESGGRSSVAGIAFGPSMPESAAPVAMEHVTVRFAWRDARVGRANP